MIQKYHRPPQTKLKGNSFLPKLNVCGISEGKYHELHSYVYVYTTYGPKFENGEIEIT